MAQESVLRIVIDSRNAERNARALANELGSIEKKGDFASKSMDSMSVATRQLAGYMAGVVTVGAAISKMDAYTGMQNRLKLVTQSQEQLNLAMSDTFSIAQKSYQSWESVIQVYQRFSDNAKTLRIDMAKTAELTETVSKAVAISGASTQAAEAALTQFGQALASGVLRGEELNSILEQTPALAKAIAQGMGITVGQLRSVAAEGKITGEVLVDALTKSKKSVDELFAKTDVTIGQSLQLLSNEVTKFTGEAGKASGVATTLASSIQILANNLDAIAGIAVVGGVALLTKTIAAQTVAIQGSIAASVARRAADAAALQSQIQLAAIEVQRTRQAVAMAATEINLARLERNSAITQAERAAATMRLTQAEIAHAIAQKQAIASTVAQTAAENALNAARSRGAMLLGLVGGPIGAITIGVAALAAGYMYLKGKTAEATAKLEEQGKVAEKTNEELTKLSGNDKISAVRDLTAAFNDQNATLAKSKESVDAVLFAIRASSVENEKARKVTEDAMNGTISYTQAVALLNKMDISPELYEMLKKQAGQYDENSLKAGNSQRVLKILGVEFKLAGNAAQNAANQVKENSAELNNNETAAKGAAKAQKDYFDSLNQDVLTANERLAYMNLGFSKDVIDQINKLQEAKQKAVGDSMTAFVTTEEINQIVQAQKALDAVKNKEDEITQAKREQNKEAEKSAKLAEKQYKYSSADLKMMQNVAKLSAEANLDGIGAKYGIPKNYLAGLMAQESGGNKNAVSPTGAVGYFQTTAAYRKDNGISVADSKNLPVIAEVVSKNLAKAFEKLGNWDAAIRSHNAGLAGSTQFEKTGKVDGNAARNKEVANFSPSVNKWIVGLGGSSLKTKGAANPLDDLKEYFAFLEDQAKSRKSLEFEVANEVTKIRENLKDKLIELDKAGFSPERTKELRDEFETRADNDIAIAEYALKTKLDDYESFRKTESQLLEDGFNERKFYASRDLELTKDQRDKAVALLDEQLKQEQALMKLAYETRLFQLRENLMSETAAMQERYRLEREQILLNSKLSQEQKLREIALSKALQEEENRKRLNNAVQQWGGIQAEMNGTGDQYSLEQQRFSRYDASQQVFDAQIGQVEQAAQDPNANMEELAAQREAIWQAHHDRMTAIDAAANQARLDLNLSNGEAIAGSMADMFKTMQGEQSGAYKAMFAIEKAMAIARSVMAIQTGIAQASALPFPANLGAMATVAAQTMSIVSNIKAVVGTGFKSGGYTGNYGTSDVAGVVHGQEYVLNAAATKRVGVGTLDAINSGKSLGEKATVVQPQINVYTLPGETADVSMNSDGSLDVRIRKIAREEARAPWTALNDPNSYPSKQVQRNTTAGVKR